MRHCVVMDCKKKKKNDTFQRRLFLKIMLSITMTLTVDLIYIGRVVADLFSSPEHNVSYCDRSMSGVRP